MSERLRQVVRAAVAIIAGSAALLVMVGSAPAESPEANPLEGVKLFVDRDTPAWQQWRAY
jgi:hypothetical protein